MLNSHEKLLKQFVDFDKLHDFMKEKGYNIGKEYLLDALLYAINETGVYTFESNLREDEKLTEKEYFEKIVAKMNGII